MRCLLDSLRSKRFRVVSEQRTTKERDFWFWPLENWNESPTLVSRHIFPMVFHCFFHLRNHTETLAIAGYLLESYIREWHNGSD